MRPQLWTTFSSFCYSQVWSNSHQRNMNKNDMYSLCIIFLKVNQLSFTSALLPFPKARWCLGKLTAVPQLSPCKWGKYPRVWQRIKKKETRVPGWLNEAETPFQPRPLLLLDYFIRNKRLSHLNCYIWRTLSYCSKLFNGHRETHRGKPCLTRTQGRN